MPRDTSWLHRRGRGIHLTIRDIDCKGFDAERMADDFAAMGVSFFSFFAGGYVTTYPSDLPYSRRSPWLGGEDITGAIVKAAHARGIKAIAMADLSILPPFVAAEHPEWASVDGAGNPFRGPSGMYTACIMGGYTEGYGRAMVREILERYDVDAMKFGGGSYGFHGRVCHCEGCRRGFEAALHRGLPDREDWEDPAWLDYHRWRTLKTSERVRFLREMVTSIRPDMPVMGNGVCFGAVDWTTNSALDIEEMAAYQDMVQIEAQDRVRVDDSLGTKWQSPTWTGEEACYMTSVTEKPIWIVVSYFKAWPWRRAAVDYAEQKVYMAQIMANGASPMVNLSGGPPAVHEDKRGFKAPTELFHFLRDHAEHYDGDRSGANVALVYSQESLVYYGRSEKEARYLEGFRGYERALQENQIPFDIISTKVLDRAHLDRYRVLVLPTLACMSDAAAEAFRGYTARGGSLVATFETGLYDPFGRPRRDFLIADLFKAHYTGSTLHVNGEEPTGKQSYLRIHRPHELLAGLEGTDLLPAAGRYCLVESVAGSEVPLRLAHPFIIFPEGLSYTAEPDLGHPMMIASGGRGGSRSVYFPGQVDRLHWKGGLPDLSLLMANAVRWCASGDLPIACEAPNTVYATLRLQEGRAMVHLVNLSGGRRYFRQIIPIRGIAVRVKKELVGPATKAPPRAFMLSDSRQIELRDEEGYLTVVVPELREYDVLVFSR